VCLNLPLTPLEAGLVEQYMFAQLGAGFNKYGMYGVSLGLGLGAKRLVPWADQHNIIADEKTRRPDELWVHESVTRDYLRDRPRTVRKWLAPESVPCTGAHFCSELIAAAMQYAGVIPKDRCAAKTTPEMLFRELGQLGFEKGSVTTFSAELVSPQVGD
jgi:hypothetical protein